MTDGLHYDAANLITILESALTIADHLEWHIVGAHIDRALDCANEALAGTHSDRPTQP